MVYQQTPKTVKALCVACRLETNHVVKAAYERTTSDRHDNDEYQETFEVVECQGCNNLAFRSLTGFVRNTDPEGDMIAKVTVYPDPLVRVELEDIKLVPESLRTIYKETMRALDVGLPVLAAVGIRAIIETICREKKAVGGSLLKKIDGLVKLGVLTQEGAVILHKLRTLGNEAAHEVKAHNFSQLDLAMRVVENLLDAVYILPHHAGATFT